MIWAIWLDNYRSLNMKKRIVILLISIWSSHSLSAQNTTAFDKPTVQALVNQNKDNFSQKQEEKRLQQRITAATLVWKEQQDKVTTMYTKLMQQVNSVFIFVADATTVAKTISLLTDLVKLQAECVELARQDPILIPFVMNNEVRVIQEATKLVTFLSLIVSSYSDLSKMDIASRRIIYTEVNGILNQMMWRTYSIKYALEQNNLKNRIKDSRFGGWINRDIQIVEDIMRELNV